MKRILTAATVLLGFCLAGVSARGQVTPERLLESAKEPQNWLMYSGDYAGRRYSTLDQINTKNAASLVPKWAYQTMAGGKFETTSLVVDGVLYATGADDRAFALDARSGRPIWQYQRSLPPDIRPCCGRVNRGMAILGDKVFLGTLDAHVIALDTKTGNVVWDVGTSDYSKGYSITLAPLVIKHLVLIGVSGGEYGIRGFVAAFDLDTGKEQWRTYTVPAPGEPGSNTWPQGDQWKTGGAPVWVTGNYDPDTNIAYWGTGNGGPTIGDQRPGDNLYTTSTLALDVTTGAIKGYFQYHQNDSWDYDEVSPPILVDYQRNGRTYKGLIDVARDGYLWFLERSAGPIKFVEGKPYVYQNVFRSLDPETGRPDVDPAHKPGTGKRADYCPGTHGGKNWPPIAFSPKTRMIYIPANNNFCSSNMGGQVQYTPGRPFVGVQGSQPFALPGADHFGEVQAWNVDTGQKVWTHSYPKSPNWGSMLATGGGLVFSGGTIDRKFHAFDATTGKLLWEFPTNSGILAPPASFAMDGKQYIAVVSGWGGDSRGDQNTLNRLFPGEFPEVPEGGAIWVFAIE